MASSIGRREHCLRVFVRTLGDRSLLEVDRAEIEAFLRSHPHVRDVHVVGVPDEKFGEAVCACIMPMPGETVALSDIVDFCRDRIAHFKVPAQVHLFDEFPMTVTGKVQKFVLRDIVTGVKNA